MAWDWTKLLRLQTEQRDARQPGQDVHGEQQSHQPRQEHQKQGGEGEASARAEQQQHQEVPGREEAGETQVEFAGFWAFYSPRGINGVAVSAAGHEAPEGDGAAGEEPEGAVGETGEVQRAGTKKWVCLSDTPHWGQRSLTYCRWLPKERDSRCLFLLVHFFNRYMHWMCILSSSFFSFRHLLHCVLLHMFPNMCSCVHPIVLKVFFQHLLLPPRSFWNHTMQTNRPKVGIFIFLHFSSSSSSFPSLLSVCYNTA